MELFCVSVYIYWKEWVVEDNISQENEIIEADRTKTGKRSISFTTKDRG